MDEHSIKRTHFLRNLLKPERLTRIVDIGASPINPAPYDMLLDEGLVKVYGFEPQPSAFEALKKNPLKNRTILPHAIGDGKEGILHVCNASGFTSLLEPNDDFIKYAGRWRHKVKVVEKITMQTKRLDDIDEIGAFDLLKIDIQGGEFAVCQNGRKKLENCLAVYSEVAFVPLYKGQHLIDSQMKSLGSLGFDLHKIITIKKIIIMKLFFFFLFV